MTELAGYRPDRLHRAWQLVTNGCVERLGGTQYRVAGNVQPVYHVDLSAEIPCYCRDAEFRNTEIHGMCKHSLAARLAGLDPALLQVIGDALAKKEALAKEAQKLARRQRRAKR